MIYSNNNEEGDVATNGKPTKFFSKLIFFSHSSEANTMLYKINNIESDFHMSLSIYRKYNLTVLQLWTLA